MTRLTVSKAREKFPQLVKRAARAKQRTVIFSRGKDVAAIISVEDLRLLERLSSARIDRVDLANAERALREVESKGTATYEAVFRKQLLLH